MADAETLLLVGGLPSASLLRGGWYTVMSRAQQGQHNKAAYAARELARAALRAVPGLRGE